MSRPIPAFAAPALASGLLALAALLAGCAVSRPPAVPAAGGVAMPTAFAEALPPTLPVEGGDPASWWAAVADERLAALVRQALAANTDVLTAQASLQRSRALRREAQAALGPGLGVSASAQRVRSGAQVADAFDAGLDASWELDLFGANGHAAAAAYADQQAAEEALQGARVSVAAEVAVDYLSAVLAGERTRIAEESAARQEQILSLVRWRQQAGLGSSLEVLQAQASLEQTRAQVPALQSSRAQSLHALAVLVGQPPASVPVVPPQLPSLPEGPSAGEPAALLRQRPDLRAAERQLVAAAERVAQADAARYPSLQLKAALSWSSLTLGTLGQAPALASVLATASQPLFDSGLRDAQLAAAQAAFDAQVQAYRAGVLNALREVEDELSALQSARLRWQQLSSAADAASQAAQLASTRHASGLVDFQAVLDTQRTLLSAQDGALVAHADLLGAEVRLVKALGGGWTLSQEKQP